MFGSIARPSARVRVDHVTVQYTHGLRAGEMAKQSGEAPWRNRDAQPQPKETIMFRTFITAAVLAMTVAAAQAGGIVTLHVGDLNPTNTKDAQLLTARIHDAAEAACAPVAVRDASPISYYGAIFEQCVYRTSNSAMSKYQALAKATATRAQIAGK